MRGVGGGWVYIFSRARRRRIGLVRRVFFFALEVLSGWWWSWRCNMLVLAHCIGVVDRVLLSEGPSRRRSMGLSVATLVIAMLGRL